MSCFLYIWRLWIARTLMVIGILVLPFAAVAGTPAAAYVFSIDPRFDQLIPPGAQVEKIADGFHWVEGPVWNREDQALYFSDIPANTVYRWADGEGVTRFLSPSGYTGTTPFAGREPGSNGLTFNSAGPGGLYVFSADGVLLGGVMLGVATSNCAWGGDGSILYIAADTAIYRIQTGTSGKLP